MRAILLSEKWRDIRPLLVKFIKDFLGVDVNIDMNGVWKVILFFKKNGKVYRAKLIIRREDEKNILTIDLTDKKDNVEVIDFDKWLEEQDIYPFNLEAGGGMLFLYLSSNGHGCYYELKSLFTKFVNNESIELPECKDPLVRVIDKEVCVLDGDKCYRDIPRNRPEMCKVLVEELLECKVFYVTDEEIWLVKDDVFLLLQCKKKYAWAWGLVVDVLEHRNKREMWFDHEEFLVELVGKSKTLVGFYCYWRNFLFIDEEVFFAPNANNDVVVFTIEYYNEYDEKVTVNLVA